MQEDVSKYVNQNAIAICKEILKIFWFKTKLTKIECQGHLAIKNFLIENNAPIF